MYRLFLFFALTLSMSFAQLKEPGSLPEQSDDTPPTSKPRVIRPIHHIQNQDMVINDRGMVLEVLPTRRAAPAATESGHPVYHVLDHQDVSARISPKHLGVVFNHAMQAQGYITGEITFKLKKREQRPTDMNLYPGFRKLIHPNVYIVVARTPLEFVQLTKRLQQRNDLEWVEPIVTYSPRVPQ